MSDEGDRASAPPRALRALTEELRESEPPPIAWDEMEARLMAKIDASVTVASDDRAGANDGFDGRAEILVPWDDDSQDVDDASSPLAGPPAAAPPTEAPAPPRIGPVALPTVASGAGERLGGRPSALPRGLEAPLAPRGGTHAARGRSRRWGFAGAVAAVAVAAAWLMLPRVAPTTVGPEPVDLASVAVEPRLGDAFDLAGLRAGDVVEASEGPVTFGRAGVLSWTLSAGGRVRVVSGVGHEEPRHVIALEAGALDVDVVPLDERRPEDGDALMGPSPSDSTFERFVVEVGGARVAVHGTAFRVVRSSRGVVLDVVRGSVAVGPLAGAEGSGQLVEAPARAAFALDGSAVRTLPALADGGVGKSAPRRASAPVAASPASPRTVIGRTSSDERYAGVVEQLEDAASKVSSPPASPIGPAASAPEPIAPVTVPPVEARGDSIWTADRVRAEVSACIARAGEKSSEGARVTIASSVVVDVDAAGSTRAVRFDPPIRPDLQACAQPVLHARFAAGTGRLLVPLEVRLGPAK